jgi:hypothetical protein
MRGSEIGAAVMKLGMMGALQRSAQQTKSATVEKTLNNSTIHDLSELMLFNSYAAWAHVCLMIICILAMKLKFCLVSSQTPKRCT